MDIRSAMNKIATRKDGVDHIWVSAFGGTQIGKLVSLKWRKKFFIPQLGEFISPDAFLAWLFSGDEAQRQNPTASIPQLSKEEFKLARQAMFFAKYHQLTALKPALVKECLFTEDKNSVITLPWFEYKQHMSGIKEHHADGKRVSIVKDMVKHLIANGSKVVFTNEDFDYGIVKKQIMEYVKEKFNLEDIIEESQVEAKDSQHHSNVVENTPYQPIEVGNSELQPEPYDNAELQPETQT